MPAPGTAAARAPALVAAAIVLLAVTNRLHSYDLWQHLLVGRVIFETHSVPTRQIWTWPTYGSPDVNTSWGFNALLWPFWAMGGFPGLSLWRGLVAILTFAAAWAAARRMGARGLAPLAVFVLCAMTYRHRAQIRPELVGALLMALTILVLERRRHRAPGRPTLTDDLSLVGLLWVWVNVHISWYLGFAWVGVHLLDAAWSSLRRSKGGVAVDGGAAVRLAGVLLLAGLLGLVNPFGWGMLREPFAYWFQYRHELIFRGISELAPMTWAYAITSRVLVLLAIWPAFALWHSRRFGVDRVEWLACAIFTAHVLHAQRFVDFYAVAAAPYLARDVARWIATRPAAFGGRGPAWIGRAGPRAAVVSAACVLIAAPDLIQSRPILGVGPTWNEFPVRACDFIEARGIRGRGFEPFYLGGYVLWRFWPERDRLPFMDIHQAGTREDRDLMARAADPAAWAELEARHRFDFVLLRRTQILTGGAESLTDLLDSQREWALVFQDDAAALYLRRGGRFDDLIARYEYRLQSAGSAHLPQIARAMEAHPALRSRLAAELDREIRESRWHSIAASRAARLALFEGRIGAARTYTEEALRVAPMIVGEHERLGVMALAEGRPAGALEEFRREKRNAGDLPRLDFRMGQAWRALGDLPRAAAAWRRAVARDSALQEARDSLAALPPR